MTEPDRLVVVGTGLIGGSFALAAKRAGLFERVTGIDWNAAHASAALRAGLVDDVQPIDAAIPEDAGVLLAVHPSHIPAWVVRLASHGAPVTDVGSTKTSVIQAVRAALGALPAHFVPGHPVAGSENSGPEAVVEELFRGRTVVLTPEPETAADAVEAVRGWWTQVGAHVQTLPATEHDAMLAFTSHLPHLVAFTMMQGADESHFDFIGGGFRDFTRIAGSDPDLWLDIFVANRDALLAAMDGFEAAFAAAREALADDDQTALHRMIDRAKLLRRRLDERR